MSANGRPKCFVNDNHADLNRDESLQTGRRAIAGRENFCGGMWRDGRSQAIKEVEDAVDLRHWRKGSVFWKPFRFWGTFCSGLMSPVAPSHVGQQEACAKRSPEMATAKLDEPLL